MTISAVGIRIRSALTAALAALALVAAVPAHAGPIEDAIEAANQRNYAGALEMLRPLALRGHPDQPLEWDFDARPAFVIVADKLSDQLWNSSASADEVRAHDADFVLAFEIASTHSESDVIANWGMRYYLAKMYLYGVGVAEDTDVGETWLRRVAESDDDLYSSRARDLLCLESSDDYC